MKRLFWPVVAAGLLLASLDLFPARYVLAPLLGLAIWRVGIASFGSLRGGGTHLAEGSPQPVDPRVERVTYWCEGCGAQLLLVVRGTQDPPRHCGERMHERHEVTLTGRN
ncbi:MAG: hypothetical protein M3N52_04240 [Actinomycetota bacterium]|nr:hypothetical protein [Actinomycetota bacterium]